MVDATPTISGQIEKAGDELALHVDELQEGVIKYEKEAKLISSFMQHRKINNAKSASFQYMGKATGQHVAGGTEVTGTNQFAHNEKVIGVDKIFEADTFVGIDDEAMCQNASYRQDLQVELGEALAADAETKMAICTILGARASAPCTGLEGGTVIKDTSMASDAAVLAAGMFAAAQAFDEKKVKSKNKTAFFRPAAYYLLAQNTDMINSLYGGSGAVKDGTIFSIADINIKKSNFVPNSNVTTVDPLWSSLNTYTGDFSDTVGIIATPRACAEVELIGTRFDLDTQKRKFGSLLIASNMKGYGWVNPSHAIELSKAAV